MEAIILTRPCAVRLRTAFLYRQRADRSAFTLIELSIVLVVIALVVGGVLAGSELIKIAELKRIMQTTEKYQTAINAFRLKYGYLPGDFPDAAMLGASAGGNGNGIIQTNAWIPGGTYPGSFNCSNSETILANEHLARAGMISLPPFNATAGTAICRANVGWLDPVGMELAQSDSFAGGTGLFVIDTSFGNFFVLGGGRQLLSAIDNVFTTTSALTPNQAFSIDSKSDDGLPHRGQVSTQVFFSSRYTGIPVGTPDACASIDGGGDYQYRKTDTLRNPPEAGWNRCVLLMTAKF